MKLIITIDTEEDNWGDYTARPTVENLRKIPRLQGVFDDFGVKPTYLISYPVATDRWAIDFFNDLIARGKCEVGMHCHPWNTPPVEEEICDRNTMLCNLPEALQYRKLSTLHEAICRNFGIVPVSFRGGRWSFGPPVARSLRRLGYRIDSSVTPYVSWASYQGSDHSSLGPEPFRCDPDRPTARDENGSLLQVPATVGFLQSNFRRCRRLMRAVETGIARKLHLKGVLYRLGLLNQVWLSPELSDAGTMIRLATRMKKENYDCLNMTFHSTSLVGGLGPFVASGDEEGFIRRIAGFLSFVKRSGFESATLAEFLTSVTSEDRRSNGVIHA